MQLTGELHTYRVTQERLLSAWPDLDHDTLRDTLEGITDLQEMIAAVVRSALVDEALQVGLRSRLEHMKERLHALSGGVKRSGKWRSRP
jgi:hypothetical protein